MTKQIRRIGRSRTARAIGALLMAYVVLLPVYGVFLDPSFPERLPFHKHVYPHGEVLSHGHSYEVRAGSDDARADTDSASDVTGMKGGVVALPFGDDGAAGALATVLTGLGLLLFIPPLFNQIFHPAERLRSGLAAGLDPPPPRRFVLVSR